MIDGEIVIATDHGLDFEALQQRIHPAESRVRMLAEQTPASFIAFDLLALGDDDYTRRPFSERRAALVDALAAPGRRSMSRRRPPISTTAQRWFDEFEGAGLDGVVAKPLTLTYQPDKRVMFKIKHERTADCVVAGYRVHKSGGEAIGSLLLGLYQDDGTARVRRRHRRVPDGRAAAAVRRAAAAGHRFRRTTRGIGPPTRPANARRARTKSRAGTPARTCPSCRCGPSGWSRSATTTWKAERFRHTAQFNRWRPDRDPRSCTYEQLEQPVTFSLGDIVPGLGSG